MAAFDRRWVDSPMMGPPLQMIREAKQSDVHGLALLMSDLGYPVSAEVLWSRIERMSSPMHRTFLAEIDGSIAGFVGCSALQIYESDVPTCWIMALSVATRFRRRGIGRMLLAEVERWCRDHDIPDIRLHSGEQRGDAHAFYNACGYHLAGVRFKKSICPTPI